MEEELNDLRLENQRLKELLNVIQKSMEGAVRAKEGKDLTKLTGWMLVVGEVQQKCSTILALIKIVRSTVEYQTEKSIRERTDPRGRTTIPHRPHTNQVYGMRSVGMGGYKPVRFEQFPRKS